MKSPTSIDSAGKLDQRAVTDQLDDAPFMLSDDRIEHRLTMTLSAASVLTSSMLIMRE